MTPVWAHWQQNPDFYRALSDFVSTRVYGEAKDFGKGTAMGIAENGAIVAALIYTNYDRRAGVIEIHGAADTPRWLAKPILWAMFQYPFDTLGCQAVVMRVDPENRRLDRILTAYGFLKYAIPRLRGRDKAEVIYVLADDDWRANNFHREHAP